MKLIKLYEKMIKLDEQIIDFLYNLFININYLKKDI
jgi:hypothetical protein